MKKDSLEAHDNIENWTKKTRLKKESKTSLEMLNERKVETKDFIKRLKSSNII